MHSQHRERLKGLATTRVRGREDLEEFVRSARTTIADLQARLAVASRRLADAEARAASAESLSATIGRMVLRAQQQVEAERLEAEREAQTMLDAAAGAAAAILTAARDESAVLQAAVADLRSVATPAARVFDFATRSDAAGELPSLPWGDGKIVAS